MWLDALEREHANFRAALRWAIDQGESETAVRLAAALYRLWYLRGSLGEGRRWFDQVLAMDADNPRSLIADARALRGAGLLAYAEGDYVAARSFTERGLALASRLNDDRLICAALNTRLRSRDVSRESSWHADWVMSRSWPFCSTTWDWLLPTRATTTRLYLF
jgi:tetratricopeptide (TPR) repeat protein